MSTIEALSREDAQLAYQMMNDVLDRIHSQIEFAEAKNAALLAANLAVIVGIGAILATSAIDQHSVRMWLFVTCLVLAGGGLIALWSFLPVFGEERHEYAKGTASAGNLVFWGDIAGVSPEQYIAGVFAALELRYAPGKIHLDLANQIVITSGIARRKFTIFKPAAVVTAIGGVVPALVLAATWFDSGMRFP